jgi:hypothetical protein
MWKRSIAVVAATCVASVSASGCYVGRHAGLGLLETAIVAAVIISAVQPPPPRVVIVPEPRPGYVWQPGYWTQSDGEWVWMDGQWIMERPAYRWIPTHWEQMPDGRWELVQGQWAEA